MKKNIIVIMTVLITLCLSACGSNNSKNQTIIFEQRVNDQYLSIIWEDREYVPYCAINPKNRGAYLGYLEDEPQEEIYEFDGYSSGEWLIDYLNMGFGGGEAMLFKEISVQDIPDGFYSEYDWNNVLGEE